MGKNKQSKKINTTTPQKDAIIDNRMNSAGVLTCQEIESLGLIKPINKTNNHQNSLQLTTYDLRLGEFHYVSSGENWVPTYIGKRNDDIYCQIKDASLYEGNLSEQGNVLTIPPYGKALVQLLEIVDTASVANKGYLVIGHFDLKLSKVKNGLISQQATQIEPYYTGRLFCYLFNLSGQEIELKYEERIASIEFLYVSNGNNSENLTKIKSDFYQSCIEKYKNSVGCGDLGILDARYFAYNKSNDGRSLPNGVGLNDIYTKLTCSIEVVNRVEKELDDQLKKCDDIIKKVNEVKDRANIAAERAENIANELNKEQRHTADQKKSNKLSIGAIITSVVICFITVFISIGLNYGWFDNIFGGNTDPPEQIDPLEQTIQLEKIEQDWQSVLYIEV